MGNVVSRCNGAELVDQGGELWIIAKRSPPHVASYLLGLIAVILLVNGIVQAVGGAGGNPRLSVGAGAIMFAFGTVFAFALVALRRHAARLAAAEDPGPLLILAGGRLLDGNRRDLVALGEVRYRKVMQLASSSRALALEWPTGEIIIARGNPFGDSIRGFVHALRSHGIAKA
jgi:hypothetical protein